MCAPSLTMEACININVVSYDKEKQKILRFLLEKLQKELINYKQKKLVFHQSTNK